MDARYARWLARDPDPETRAELEALAARGGESELTERFSTRLAFGTAGLRGLFGCGPNRMNRVVVRESTTGLGTYLLRTLPDAAKRGVVVGYDGRKKSREFAEDTACVLAALGIAVRVLDRELPTPVLAFAVKERGAAAGVMITASHNPPDYNGYKVYWENGAQIIPPIDAGIARAIDEAATRNIPWMSRLEAEDRGLLAWLGDETVEAYLRGVAALSVHPRSPARERLSIAYTPLHGVGARVVEEALRRAGFTGVHTEPSQREPDGAFPTVSFPNPEEAGAMDRVVALAQRVKADLVLANDPDADRMAVALPDGQGGYAMLTGDQVGVLLGDDRMRAAPSNAVVATTIVSSRMLGAVARARGVDYFETLTGFKWIANGALARRGRGQTFVFGYEEALGYTLDDLVRCKDGVSAIVAFAELAADCAQRGQTLQQRLEALYREHGLYLTRQKSLALVPGASVGEKLRKARPARVGGRVVQRADDLSSGSAELPKSDVLVYHLEGDARVIVRPSGTEPKLKCYYEVREPVRANEPLAEAEARARMLLAGIMEAHQAEIAAL